MPSKADPDSGTLPGIVAMLEIVATGEILGATVKGVDLSHPLSDGDFDSILYALGRYGVLRFPGQSLSPVAQKTFAGRFGSLEVNVAGMFQDAEHPEIMFLSNIVENGKPIGLADAGQDWHTDMSYSAVIALANVLYAIKVPRDESGCALGATRFANMHAAYNGLPEDIKDRLADATAVHDFNKFWEMMRREKGSNRPPLTEEQRRKKPPVSHPVFLNHPITGHKVLYADPGYTTHIEGMPAAESDEILSFLFAHQLKPQFQYEHRWSEGDLMMWDNIGTLHTAINDYGPHQPRLMQRCQVIADRIFERPLAGAT
jgi:alpha-ketoglutarate-dependent taurine dioxygenase